ncbi:NUDIX hydrolase [archaeon]|jgi:8-oxo-dGTP diphosphatase|nr:NUDIX hydrolase [archaeon]MBT3577257.1 NUDIX hydrolase [archaeon]MBT6820501.1 NUDIX hydrolase [archaeon]MBT6956177.1 NUDIX hydrolase [archaeon]MBT7025751.1 NUDIX hydrolase [archaeon]
MKLTDYKQPSVTTDVIIFAIKNNELNVLLIKRGIEPFKRSWTVPGGFVDIKDSIEDTAKKKLKEKTGVDAKYLEQLYTFGDPKRDPRGRVISIAYFALINPNDTKLSTSPEAEEVKWFPVKSLPKLAFDHKKILDYAIQRLRWKFEYTTIAFSILPKKFSLTQLQKIYETIFDKKFDKRNFRKKILSLDIVKETQEFQEGVSFRPAHLYKFTGKIGDIIKMI